MQVLEKILEEIIERLKEEGCIIDDAAGNRAEEIIRSHMNDNSDGWILCSERLPGMYETVMVSAKMKEDKEYLVYMASRNNINGWEIIGVKNCDEYNVVAYQPLPEPYKPKETQAAGMEHIMSRFTKSE